jgi:hypothetical protein
VFYDRTIEFLRANPGVYARLCWARTKWFFSLTGTKARPFYYHLIAWLTAGLVIPLGFIGAILAMRRYRGTWILLIVILYHILLGVFLNGDTRFRHPVEPYFIIFAAFLMVSAAARFMEKFFPHKDLNHFFMKYGLGPSPEEKASKAFYDPSVPVSISQKEPTGVESGSEKKQDATDRH